MKPLKGLPNPPDALEELLSSAVPPAPRAHKVSCDCTGCTIFRRNRLYNHLALELASEPVSTVLTLSYTERTRDGAELHDVRATRSDFQNFMHQFLSGLDLRGRAALKYIAVGRNPDHEAPSIQVLLIGVKPCTCPQVGQFNCGPSCWSFDGIWKKGKAHTRKAGVADLDTFADAYKDTYGTASDPNADTFVILSRFSSKKADVLKKHLPIQTAAYKHMNQADHIRADQSKADLEAVLLDILQQPTLPEADKSRFATALTNAIAYVGQYTSARSLALESPTQLDLEDAISSAPVEQKGARNDD